MEPCIEIMDAKAFYKTNVTTNGDLAPGFYTPTGMSIQHPAIEVLGVHDPCQLLCETATDDDDPMCVVRTMTCVLASRLPRFGFNIYQPLERLSLWPMKVQTVRHALSTKNHLILHSTMLQVTLVAMEDVKVRLDLNFEMALNVHQCIFN
ncbi:hypothetical protein AC1031_018535 [Aphanomyces cochlioides]|nr:hypothetical protein AC1031_018535 [Aphanomyces cochlioides]